MAPSRALSIPLGAAPPETMARNSFHFGFPNSHTQREQSRSLIQFVHFMDRTIKQVLKHLLTA